MTDKVDRKPLSECKHTRAYYVGQSPGANTNQWAIDWFHSYCPKCGAIGESSQRLGRRKWTLPSDTVDRKPLEDMDIRDIACEWLKVNGFDGLCNSTHGCACELVDLMPCGAPSPTGCLPGYKVSGCSEECGNGCAFHIEPEKPKQE